MLNLYWLVTILSISFIYLQPKSWKLKIFHFLTKALQYNG